MHERPIHGASTDRTRARRRLIIGWALFVTGLMVAIPLVAVFWLNPLRGLGIGQEQLLLAAIAALFAALCIKLGRDSIARARRGLQISAQAAIAHSSKIPILYLRSFADDRSCLAYGEDDYSGDLIPVKKTIEEYVVEALEEMGPVIAVGRPGEELPEIGASRAYFDDDVWQTNVEALIDKSQFVVIRIANSEGLLWEIKRSVQKLSPEQLLLFVPFPFDGDEEIWWSLKSLTDRTQYREERFEQFRKVSNSNFPQGLPTAISDAFWIRFRHDWSPYLVGATWSRRRCQTKSAKSESDALDALLVTRFEKLKPRSIARQVRDIVFPFVISLIVLGTVAAIVFTL